MDVADTSFNDYEAEKVKHRLTEVEKYDFRVRSMEHGPVPISVTRSEFEEEVSALITQAEFCLEGALDKASLKMSDIKGVYMAGGTSKIPAVQRSVERLTSLKPKVRNPEQSISLGSALFAAYKLGLRTPAALTPEVRANVGSIRVQDVAPYFIGTIIGVRRDSKRVIVNTVLIPKGTPLPSKVTKQYYVPADGSKTIPVDVTMCPHETEDIEEVKMLADEHMPLGANSEQGDPIEVTFEINENGQFKGLFKDVKSGNTKVIDLQINPDVGTPPDLDDFLV